MNEQDITRVADEVRTVVKEEMGAMVEYLGGARTAVTAFLFGVTAGSNISTRLRLTREDIARGETAYALAGGLLRDQTDPRELVNLFSSYALAREVRRTREAGRHEAAESPTAREVRKARFRERMKGG